VRTTLLIDVSPLAYRAFYGAPKPHADHAVDQLIVMLERLIKTHNPTHAAACFDARGPTWRHLMCPEYKATRKAKDPSLYAFLNQVRPVVEAFGLHTVTAAGYEADDIICSLVHQNDGCTVISSDKDFYQFFGVRGARFYDPGKRREGHEFAGDWITRQDVHALFGIDVDQGQAARCIEIQALCGDSSDNIPGCPGIGQKGAVMLIAEYGTARGALDAASADELPKHLRRWRKHLLIGGDSVRMSRELVTMSTDLCVSVGLVRPADRAALAAIASGA